MADAIRVGYPASGSVTWSDGTPFNGYALIGIKQLLDGASQPWPELVRGGSPLRRVLPKWVMLPIQNGNFVTTCGVIYNADLTPPQSQYVAFYYDATGKAVGTASAAFTVTASTFTVPSVTLTAPTVGSNPTPN